MRVTWQSRKFLNHLCEPPTHFEKIYATQYFFRNVSFFKNKNIHELNSIDVYVEEPFKGSSTRHFYVHVNGIDLGKGENCLHFTNQFMNNFFKEPLESKISNVRNSTIFGNRRFKDYKSFDLDNWVYELIIQGFGNSDYFRIGTKTYREQIIRKFENMEEEFNLVENRKKIIYKKHLELRKSVIVQKRYGIIKYGVKNMYIITEIDANDLSEEEYLHWYENSEEVNGLRFMFID